MLQNFPEFHGKRLGFELPHNSAHEKESMPTILPAIELLNYNLLKHSEYATYDNWKYMLDTAYNPVQFSMPENRINSVKRDSNVAPGIYPIPFDKRVLVKPLSFSMNWEIYAYNYPGVSKEGMLKFEKLAYDAKFNAKAHEDSHVDFVSSLLNMNVSLKSRDHEEILKLVYGFGFYDSIISDKINTLKGAAKGNKGFLIPSGPKAKEYLERDFKSYVGFIEKLQNSALEEKSYKKFMKKQASQQ